MTHSTKTALAFAVGYLLFQPLQAIAGSSNGNASSSGKLPVPAAGRPIHCNAAVQDDWIGRRNPYKPVYSLHDTSKLPDWLSFSVEQRTRYEGQDGAFRFGAEGGDQALPIQNCAWLEVRHQGFRAGVEFLDARQFLYDEGSAAISRVGSRIPVTNTQVNEADFLQVYGAWAAENVGGSGVDAEVKLGRQTLDLGYMNGRRLVARNVFRNTVNAFTGALIRLRDHDDHWQMKFFGFQPVGRNPSAADDIMAGQHDSDEEESRTFFSGGHVEWFNVLPTMHAEAYLLHLDEHDRPGGDTANRRLYTPGVRTYRQPAKGHWDFETETIGQIGSSRASAGANDTRDLDHRAWFQHVQLGYTFDLPWAPRFHAMYDYASGDSNSRDGENNRFDTLYGARRWELGPTGTFGALARANINTPGYRLSLAPRDNITTFFQHRLVWLAEGQDEWVGTGLRDRTGRSGDFVGHTFEVSARWDVNNSLTLDSGWTRIAKGEFAMNAPGAPDGNDVDYFYVQSLVRF
ncbi:MAG: alginate export family protein [Methylomonas sp.]|nr:alginate export family protein [Methylomonas sp.]PPD21664.1 MAG: hypothetical protein CTY23_04645 [Methylomonas sp.]PPD25955.1 MAG: hypothetical protein CTY22_06810 [Methylomonas sp.]PPD37691.1 MAG: hypothetical protein CTY21_06810 [Methylomonas sp.]PPD39298.1 MAG: hypothetical protein CTY17_08255 [Methylomonas sp.]